MIDHCYTMDANYNLNVDSDSQPFLTGDNRMAYFKKMLKEFEKSGLRGLRSTHKTEIAIVLDDYK